MHHSMSRADNGGRNRLLLWHRRQRRAGALRRVPRRAGCLRCPDDLRLDPGGGRRRPRRRSAARDLLRQRLRPRPAAAQPLDAGQPRFALLEGDKGFTTPTSKVLGHDSFKGMGVDFGDLNGDGRLDIYVSNIAQPCRAGGEPLRLDQHGRARAHAGGRRALRRPQRAARPVAQRLGLGRPLRRLRQRRRARGAAGDRLRRGHDQPLAGAARAGHGQRQHLLHTRGLAALPARRRPHRPPAQPLLRARRRAAATTTSPRSSGSTTTSVSRGIAAGRRGRRRRPRLRGGNQWEPSFFYRNDSPRAQQPPWCSTCGCRRHRRSPGPTRPAIGAAATVHPAGRPAAGRPGGRRQRPLGQARPRRSTSGSARADRSARRCAVERDAGATSAGAVRQQTLAPHPGRHTRAARRQRKRRAESMADARRKTCAWRRCGASRSRSPSSTCWATRCSASSSPGRSRRRRAGRLRRRDRCSRRLDCRVNGPPPALPGRRHGAVDFLLSAHITGLAVAMLLYANEQPAADRLRGGGRDRLEGPLPRPGPTAAAGTSSTPPTSASRRRCSASPGWGSRRPTCSPRTSRAAGDWILPAIIVCSGTFLNAKFTKRLPLILAWLGGFVLQAAVRHLLLGNLFLPSLNPMTGVAFLLFTFYMVTDPATTPSTVRGQVAFGAAVAAAYGVLMALHVVFGLFFALSFVCAARGVADAGCRALAAAAGRARRGWRSPVPAMRARAVTASPSSGWPAAIPDARTPAELWENVLARRRAFRRHAARAPAPRGLPLGGSGEPGQPLRDARRP